MEQNIVAQLLDEYSPMFAEPDFLLREELRELAPYHAVLHAIADGGQTPKDIAAKSGVAEKNLPYHLRQLQEIGYVGRSARVHAPAQSATYELGDPWLRFWFRFVFPNQSAVVRGGPEVFDRRIRGRLPA